MHPVSALAGQRVLSQLLPCSEMMVDYWPLRLSEQMLTGSLVDSSIFASHHWRLVQGKVITTIEERGKYTTQTLDSMLYGLGGKGDMIFHANGNQFDYTRENVRLNRMSKQSNQYLPAGKTTYLVIGALTILIDAEDESRCRLYVWTTVAKAGQLLVRAHYRENDQSKQILLAKYLTGWTGHASKIEFVNGDSLDYRKANLNVKSRY